VFAELLVLLRLTGSFTRRRVEILNCYTATA
jgi:hypothetical protein